jgi:sulfite reductase (NADPH) flavoprotein alpha-component
MSLADLISPELEAGPAGHSAARPFEAPVLDNFVLTGPGSGAEKRHVEFDLRGSGLSYRPGDALGIVPRNDPRLVDVVLAALGADGHAPVQIDGSEMTFEQALATRLEIAGATPRFLKHWAMLSGSADLRALAAPDNTELRRRFLHAHHIQDIARRYPVAGLGAEAVLPGLRPLQPRLYSISSSPAVDASRAAITTATLAYPLHGETRLGAVTGYGIPRARPGTTLPVFVQPDPQFRLPSGGDIIMIAAGTGIAPFRAFLAERRACGHRGRSWLIFGTRTRRDDFLYGDEWQRAVDDGTLTRLDLAFSRDAARKVYVQHLLLEQAATVYAWLQDGASIYVCGDAAAMAPAVHASLLEIIRRVGHKSPAEAAAYLRSLVRDGRYCRSIY